AFSTEYAMKDLGYALELGKQTGVNMRGAALIRSIFEEAIEGGMGDAYFPVIARLLDSGK
ncbi:hypothetical protein, partial [Streptomyces sp. P17]|uniref:hypothetical protein n=1 Tax=Streptomyces sp. P17 TaxID=3074716 RepID=UPI0028F40DCC